MLKIWGRAGSANVMKLLWCCAEIGIPYERVDIGGDFGGLDTPDYLAMNPNGRIPVIQDEVDGKTFTLWESNTILRYLCARHSAGRLYPDNLQQRADIERWMDWNICHILPGMQAMFFGLIRTPPEQRNLAAIENGRQQNELSWRLLDRHLAGRTYIRGDAFSMAEFGLGIMAYRWLSLPIERPTLSHLEAWQKRLADREAYRTYVMLPLV